MNRLRDSAGQTLVEIAIAMTILSTILLAAASTAAAASKSGTDAYLQFVGSNYVQQGLQQMLLYRDVKCPAKCGDTEMFKWTGDQYIVTPSEDPATWYLSGPQANIGDGSTISDDPAGRFSRYIHFSPLPNGVPGLTGGSTIDEVKVDVHVVWHDQSGQRHDVSQGTSLADWKAAE